MSDFANKFYAKVQKYGGWKLLAAQTIHSVFLEVVNPAAIGFVLAKNRYLAKQIDDEIFQVIKLDALKGRAYGLSYGLSLAYVPYPYLPRVKWRRTLKTVSLDLHEKPQSQLGKAPQDGPDGERIVASTLLGEECFREELGNVWSLCWPRISAWFDSTRNLDGILAICGRHLDRPLMAIRHVPSERLIRAFTYARLGQREEAKADLDIFFEENNEGSEARRNLQAALEQVGARKPRT